MSNWRKFFVGEKENLGSPLESRWMGEVCEASVNLSRAKANELVCYLLGKYEGDLRSPPEGSTFEELYDLKKMEPKKTYLDLYKEVKEELAKKGLNFQS